MSSRIERKIRAETGKKRVVCCSQVSTIELKKKHIIYGCVSYVKRSGNRFVVVRCTKADQLHDD